MPAAKGCVRFWGRIRDQHPEPGRRMRVCTNSALEPHPSTGSGCYGAPKSERTQKTNKKERSVTITCAYMLTATGLRPRPSAQALAEAANAPTWYIDCEKQKPKDTSDVLKSEQYAHYDDAHHNQENCELSSVGAHGTLQ